MVEASSSYTASDGHFQRIRCYSSWSEFCLRYLPNVFSPCIFHAAYDGARRFFL